MATLRGQQSGSDSEPLPAIWAQSGVGRSLRRQWSLGRFECHFLRRTARRSAIISLLAIASSASGSDTFSAL